MRMKRPKSKVKHYYPEKGSWKCDVQCKEGNGAFNNARRYKDVNFASGAFTYAISDVRLMLPANDVTATSDYFRLASE